jgi:hypothetical protein
VSLASCCAKWSRAFLGGLVWRLSDPRPAGLGYLWCGPPGLDSGTGAPCSFHSQLAGDESTVLNDKFAWTCEIENNLDRSDSFPELSKLADISSGGV